MPLPPWASLKRDQQRRIKDHEALPETLTLEQEELYLRNRAFREVCQEIDEAVQDAIHQELKPLVEQVRVHFSKCDLKDEAATDPESATAKSSICATVLPNPFVVEPPRRYNPSLLPLTILRNSSNLLDRHYILTQIIASLRTTPRTAVCFLRNLHKSSVANHCGDWVEDIVRQCILQEERVEHHGAATKRKRKRSQVQSLLRWAKSQKSFDSLTIVIEGSERVAAGLFQDLLSLLQDLRSQHGLSLSILLSQQGVERVPYHQSGQFLVQTLTVPLPHKILPHIWDSVSLVLPAAVLQIVMTSFQNYHQSLQQTMEMVKQGLLDEFQQRDSTLTAIQNKSFMKMEWKRLAWFCLDAEGRQVLMGKQMTKEQVLEVISIRMEHRQTFLACTRALVALSSSQVGWLPMAVALVSNTRRENMAEKLVVEFKKLSHDERMQRIVTLLDVLESGKKWCVHDDESMRSFQDFVGQISPTFAGLDEAMEASHRMVVILDNANREKDDVFEIDLGLELEQWMLLLMRIASDMAPTCKDHWQTAHSLLPQQRRAVAVALDTPPIEGTPQQMAVAGELFRLISTRVSIPRHEWFHLYQEWSKIDPEEAWSLFALGVYQLLFIGLIRERRSNSATEVVYEKVALVWSTGE